MEIYVAKEKDDDIEGDNVDPSIVAVRMLSKRDSNIIKVETHDEKIGFCLFLKTHGYWSPLMETIKFLIHFVFVMSLLFGGAILFALIEDPETNILTDIIMGNSVHQNPTNIVLNSTKGISTYTLANESFWNHVEGKYNISVRAHARVLLMKEFKNFIIEEKKRAEMIAHQTLHKDNMFVFLKWFYFVTIATTTIGYGDVSPKTDNGKLFYIFFSIIGIILMMTLLRKCGKVLSAANRKFYGLINRYLCRNKQIVSEQLMSAISIIFIFLCYLFTGIWYGKNMAKTIDWSLIDVVYFWIVTFSTVGFGDITHPLEKEVEHVYVYLVYRVFGLAFLAAIIDAIQQYVHVRKKYFEKKKKQLIHQFDSRATIIKKQLETSLLP